MVLPFLGALAGAGGSIASAILGADAQDSANQWNWYINEQNLRDQRKARREAIDYAEGIRSEQKLGGTDALGNRTYFKEGVGWVTELDPEQQALYDYFFRQELPERQAQFQRSAEQSRTNADQANQLLDMFIRTRRQLPYEAEAQLYEKASRGIAEGSRKATEAATRQATRMGSSNIEGILAAIAGETMRQDRDARLDASMQAEDYVDQKYNSERAGLAQLYQMFLGNSAQPLNPSYDPTGLPQQANQLMNLFSQQAQQGNSAGMQAMMQPMPVRQNIEPNMAWANGAGAIGAALSGLGERAGAISEKNDMNNLMKMYITGGGALDMSGGGIFGRTTDRLQNMRTMF